MRKSVLFPLLVIAALIASLPVAARAAQQTIAPGTLSSAGTAGVFPTLPVLLPAAGGAGDTSAAGIQMAATTPAGGSATPAASTDGAARADTSGPALRASRILGDTVTDNAGNEIGQVDNLLVDSGSGCVLYAVVTGGAAGAELGERAFFVPWSLLTFSEKQNAFVLNAGADALANAPHLDRYTAWPSLGAPGWDGQIRDYWQRYGPNGRLGVTCGVTATAGAAGSTALPGSTVTPARVAPAVTAAGTVAGGTAGALRTVTPPATAGAGIGGSPLGTPAARVNVTLQEFTIILPATIPAGPTTFVVTNAGTLSHNFEIAGQGLDQKFSRSLEPGESATMGANLRPGSYQVFCPVDGHRAQGMQMQLTVTAAGGTGGSPAPGRATASVRPGGPGSATPGATGRALTTPSWTPSIGAAPAATATAGARDGTAGAATPAGPLGPGTGTPGRTRATPGRVTTPTGAGATTAASQAGTPTAGSAGTPDATGRLMSTQNIVGAAVQDATGKDLGRISDLVANLANDSVTYVVLSHGGVLGLGAQAVAVPWPALAFDPGRQVFRLNVAQAVLDRAPTFDPQAVDGGSPDWDAGVRSYWQSQGLPAGNPPAPGTPSATPTAQADAGTATGTSTSGPATVSPSATAGPAAGGTSLPNSLPLAGLRGNAERLNRLLGYRVKAVNGADMGDAVGLALAMGNRGPGNGQATTGTPGATANGAGAGSAANSGQIIYVLVGRGGLLGLGRQIVPVPWPLLTLSQVNRTLTINADEQTFRQAPSADVNSPATAQGSDWDAAAQAYWAGQMNEMPAAGGTPAAGTGMPTMPKAP